MKRFISCISIFAITICCYAQLGSLEKSNDTVSIKSQSKYEAVVIDSINSVLANRSLWFNVSLLGWHHNYSGYNPNVPPSVLYNSDGHCCETYAGEAPHYCYDWPNKSKKTFSEGMIGGNSWSFFRAKLLGVRLMPTVIPPNFLGISYSDKQKKYKKYINIWGENNYYFVIVPDSIETYRMGADNKTVIGSEIKDTLLIFYNQKKLNYILSDTKLHEFEQTFNEGEQNAWNSHMSHFTAKYEIISKAYGKDIADVICRGEVLFGFTSEMCNLAYEGEPFQIAQYVSTPFGNATVYDFYTKGVKLHFVNNLLIGIQWKNGKIKYK